MPPIYSGRLLWTIVIIGATLTFGSDIPEICSVPTCNPAVSTRPELKALCDSFGAGIIQRCCLNSTSILGLDLSNCGLNNLAVFGNETFYPAKARRTLQLMLLDANPLSVMNENNFTGFVALNSITVPGLLPCPGAEYNAWNETAYNQKDNLTMCSKQQSYCDLHYDACIELEEYPNNAMCVPDGPSLFLCPCSPGYYGYKCLRHGEFPTAIFAPLISVLTVVLSAVLWFTQRRFVINSPHETSAATSHEH